MERNLEINTTMLKDSFSILTKNGGVSQKYAQGVYMGTALGLVAVGIDYDTAKKVCKQCLPDQTMEDIIPEGW